MDVIKTSIFKWFYRVNEVVERGRLSRVAPRAASTLHWVEVKRLLVVVVLRLLLLLRVLGLLKLLLKHLLVRGGRRWHRRWLLWLLTLHVRVRVAMHLHYKLLRGHLAECAARHGR